MNRSLPAPGSSLAADPGAVASLRSAIDAGHSSPHDLLAAAMARIEAVEAQVQGWRLVDRDGAAMQAGRSATARGGAPTGPLHGIPVAVKDVIDVAGMPTRAGSRSRRNVAPAAIDAQVVARLRAAGATILGKAHTTEFAFFDGPPPTRNPHDLARTPGGSSSGPAAVVAAGMVPLALGTQTAGSVSRPAAYCGIAAFKPSTGAWSSFGVVPFAPSFDTVGIFGWRVADAAFGARALMPDFLAGPEEGRPDETPWTIVLLDDPELETARPAVARTVRETGERLRDAGYAVETRRAPERFADLAAQHLVVREFELGHAQAGLLEAAPGDVTPSLVEAVARGLAIPLPRYLAALATLATARQRFWAAIGRRSAVIVPAAPDIAPVGMATGDARFIIPMTALGGPIVSIPVGFDQGLPLGVMLASAPGSDAALLDLAQTLAPQIEVPR